MMISVVSFLLSVTYVNAIELIERMYFENALSIHEANIWPKATMYLSGFV